MRVACSQYAVRDGDNDANLELSLRHIRRAASGGADLVVLPELANSGGPRCRDEALELAEPVPDGPTVRAWMEVAGEYGLHVVGGILERDGDALHNSAVVVGPGLFGRYRKTHLWDAEKVLYEAGSELPVFDTPLGAVGVLVCYDAWFPEAARALALAGAEVICVPANAPDDWVPEHQRVGGLTMLGVHAISHANANRVFVAVANRVGDGYLGRSCIVGPDGGVLGLGSAAEEALIHADLDPGIATRSKRLTNRSHAFHDRNTTAYGRAGAGETGR